MSDGTPAQVSESETANVEAIVAKLTKAQRIALGTARRGGFGFPSGSLMHNGRPSTGRALFERKLVSVTGFLTPLGYAVRAELLAAQVQA